MLRTLILFFLAAMAAVAVAAGARIFTDPAPPVVQALRDQPAPLPQKNPDVTYHAAPKPLPAGAVTSDWTSFLGPMHNMVSSETKLLKTFPKGEPKLVWEMTKGDSYASPAIAGERLVLFHRLGSKEIVDCVNALDGRRYWQYSYPTSYRDRYGYHNGPRCSPILDAESVFTYGAAGKLHCLNLKTGQVRWKRDLCKEFKVDEGFFGVGATPLVEGEKLIVNVGAPGGPCVAAFDVRTGKLVWGAGDPKDPAGKWGPSYASPIPATVHGKRRVFVFAGGESRPPTGGLLCIDPSNGRVDFAFPWRGTVSESVNASSPLVIGNRVFISECYGSGGALVEMNESGAAKLIWKNAEFGTHFMTAVAKDGYLYGIDGHGPQDAFFVCVDMKTGKEIWRTQPEWQEQVTEAKGKRTMKLGTFRCTLLMVDGRCLCLGEFGHLLWLDLNPKGYRELARTWLFAAPDTWTPPVISRGLLYICQNNRDQYSDKPPRLLCYDLRVGG